jgi:hypothetical protein
MSKFRPSASSLPGLTRQSILLRNDSFSIDARVKPAHDDWASHE